MSKHTVGPWYAHGYSIYAEDGLPVGQMAADYCADTILGNDWRRFNEQSKRSDDEALANAAFIVKAVNCHEELLAVAKGALEELRLLRTKDIAVVYDPTLRVRLMATIEKAEGK